MPTRRAAPRAALAALLALAALVLAGCTAAPEPAPRPTSEQPPVEAPPAGAPPAPPEEASPWPRPPGMATFPFRGKLTLAAGDPGYGYFAPLGSVDPHSFVVGVLEHATAIRVELTWADPVQDLDLEVAPPGCDLTTGVGCIFVTGGAPGAPDSPVIYEVTDPALLALSGDWFFIVWAKAAVDQEFAGAITVAYAGAPLPERPVA